MHVVIVGCGRVGAELAARLTAADHTVAVIDKRPEAFERLPDTFAGEAIAGLGFDRDRLESAGIRKASGFAAVTNGDNSNILSARIAKETFAVPHVVARIYDPRRAAIYQRLGIPTVATVSRTTDQVVRRLFPESTHTDWTDPGGDLALVERDLPSSWAGHALAALDGADRFRLVAVTRAGVARIADHSLIGQEGDVLHVLVQRGVAGQLDDLLGRGPEEAR